MVYGKQVMTKANQLTLEIQKHRMALRDLEGREDTLNNQFNEATDPFLMDSVIYAMKANALAQSYHRKKIHQCMREAMDEVKERVKDVVKDKVKTKVPTV